MARLSISAAWNERSQRHLTRSLQHDGDSWWDKKGRVLGKHIAPEWALCLMACEGVIAFDAVLCQGPRHRNSIAPTLLPESMDPRVACFAVPPCQSCHAAPEGALTPQSSRFSLPLLNPPPLLSSNVLAGVSPQSPDQSFVARCADCLRDRYCSACHAWWCEDCYNFPSAASAKAAEALGGLGTSKGSPNAYEAQPKVRDGFCHACSAWRSRDPADPVPSTSHTLVG